MKLPKKTEVMMKLKGKKFSGKFHDWFMIQEDGVDKIKGSREKPGEDDREYMYRHTISSAVIMFHGKNVVETKNSFYLLGKKL